jgi:hypothetical protein
MMTVYSRYILFALAMLIMPHSFAQQTKKAGKQVKTAVPKKRVTEAEAKRLHEEQLAREGKSGTRRAYKRSDIEKLQHTADSDMTAAADKAQKERADAPVVVRSQPPAKQPAAVSIVKNEPKEPKFIEGIVLERQR